MRAEHLMRLHWGEVVNGLVVTKAVSLSVRHTSIRKSPFPLISVPFILLTHLHPSPPTHPLTSPHNPTQSAGIYLESCSMSKEIVQLRELFQYISGSQWTSYLNNRPLPLPPSPHCFFPSAHLECACRERHILARVLLSGSHSPIRLPFGTD